jgi:hypothetical protein
LKSAGSLGTAIARAVERGQLMQLGGGLYQSVDAQIGAGQSLAEASQRMTEGVICLMSALARPARPVAGYSLDSDRLEGLGAKTRVSATQNKRYGGTLPYQWGRNSTGFPGEVYQTIPCITYYPMPFEVAATLTARLRLMPCAPLDQKKATPGELAKAAKPNGVRKIVRPYFEAMTSNR